MESDKVIFRELKNTLKEQQNIYIKNTEDLKGQINKYFGE
jgi:hypothetical protein